MKINIKIKISATGFGFFPRAGVPQNSCFSVFLNQVWAWSCKLFFFFFFPWFHLYFFIFIIIGPHSLLSAELLLSPCSILAPLCPVHALRHFIKLMPKKIHLINWDSQQWLSLPGKKKKGLNHTVTLPTGEGKSMNSLFSVLCDFYINLCLQNTPCE